MRLDRKRSFLTEASPIPLGENAQIFSGENARDLKNKHILRFVNLSNGKSSSDNSKMKRISLSVKRDSMDTFEIGKLFQMMRLVKTVPSCLKPHRIHFHLCPRGMISKRACNC